MSTHPLIGAHELLGAMNSAHPPLLLDVRWQLLASRPEDPARPAGYADYLEAHLPGAVFVDLSAELAGPASNQAGRHPLPEPADFARAVERWGLAQGQVAVFYDDQGGLSAARGWWLARHAGLEARVLDGGLQAWIAAGGECVAGPGTPPVPEQAATVGWGQLPVLDAEATAALAAEAGDGASDAVVLDARAGERYRGESEPIDPRAGHIPGAASLPTAGNLAPGRRLLPVPALRERFAAVGAVPGARVGVYCGSGVTASHQILALAAAGVDAALYSGSWSQWSRDDAREVATGPSPR